jgi:hypothetical protein
MWGNAIPSSEGRLLGEYGATLGDSSRPPLSGRVTALTRGVRLAVPLAVDLTQAPSCGTSQPCRTSGRKY